MTDSTETVEAMKESRLSEIEAKLVARLRRVEARSADLAKELKVMRGKNETVTSRVDKMQKAAIDVRRVADAVNEDLEKAKSRLAETHRALHAAALRYCVMTEVPRLLRGKREDSEVVEFYRRMAVALDEPHEWWAERDALTLGEWIELIDSTALPASEFDLDRGSWLHAMGLMPESV